MSTRVISPLALVGVWAMLAACSKGANRTDSAAGVDTTASAAAMPTTSTPPATLSDPNIAALLDEANAGDSAAASVAVKKATNASVRTFARDMVREHHLLRKQGQDLATKIDLTPAAPSGDTLLTSSQRWADSLNAMPKGVEFDRAYIDHEVAAHQAVQSLLQTAASSAQDTSLKALITKAQPTIDAQLKRARHIQSKLSGGATAGAGISSDSTKMGAKKAASKKP